ncbi:MAG: exo-alpha-sialidase, partial [Opitutaceae bacterium]|nr:exo-alpha-sialidase [Opitutaceae bacterium]
MKLTFLLRCLPAILLPLAGVRAAEFSAAAQPQLAATAEGRVYVAFGRGREIFVARSDDGGGTFAPANKVATLPKLKLGMRRGPRIAAHGDSVTVTAMADELFAFRSKNAGQTWDGPVRINDIPGAAREGLQGSAAAPDGRLFVTWLDLRNVSGARMQLFGAESADGGATWSANHLVYRAPAGETVCECCHPSAAFDARGNLAVMWRNGVDGARDMWSVTRGAGAREFGAPAKIGEGTWPLKACPMDGGAVFADRTGFASVWRRANEIFFAVPGQPEEKIADGMQPVAARAGDSLVVVWQQGPDLWLTRKGLAAIAPARHAANARFPSLLALPNGRAILAYEQG